MKLFQLKNYSKVAIIFTGLVNYEEFNMEIKYHDIVILEALTRDSTRISILLRVFLVDDLVFALPP